MSGPLTLFRRNANSAASASSSVLVPIGPGHSLAQGHPPAHDNYEEENEEGQPHGVANDPGCDLFLARLRAINFHARINSWPPRDWDLFGRLLRDEANRTDNARMEGIRWVLAMLAIGDTEHAEHAAGIIRAATVYEIARRRVERGDEAKRIEAENDQVGAFMRRAGGRNLHSDAYNAYQNKAFVDASRGMGVEVSDDIRELDRSSTDKIISFEARATQSEREQFRRVYILLREFFFLQLESIGDVPLVVQYNFITATENARLGLCDYYYVQPWMFSRAGDHTPDAAEKCVARLWGDVTMMINNANRSRVEARERAIRVNGTHRVERENDMSWRLPGAHRDQLAQMGAVAYNRDGTPYMRQIDMGANSARRSVPVRHVTDDVTALARHIHRVGLEEVEATPRMNVRDYLGREVNNYDQTGVYKWVW